MNSDHASHVLLFRNTSEVLSMKIDMVGRTIGRWKVIEQVPERSKNRDIQYFCQCECGTTRVMTGSYLRSGHTNSCGCYNREVLLMKRPSREKHGMAYHKLHNVWSKMKRRCENENDKATSIMVKEAYRYARNGTTARHFSIGHCRTDIKKA